MSLQSEGDRILADKVNKLVAILNGETTIAFHLEFLIRNNHADLLILKSTKVCWFMNLHVVCLLELALLYSTLHMSRPATIHRCIGASWYFLPRYEYCILNKLSRYLRYIHICINKHGKALSSISAHPPSTF